MPIKSRALEVNLAGSQVDVVIDNRYLPLKDVMSRYYGLMDGINTFLTELSHPYKNWKFIVQETRKYGLDYFHYFQKHPLREEVIEIIIGVFLDAAAEAAQDVRADAVDNLMLFLQKTLTESYCGSFDRILENAFERIHELDENSFWLFVRSFYPVKKLAELYLHADDTQASYKAINKLISKCHHYSFSYWLSLDDPMSWFEKEAETTHKPIFDDFFSDVSHSKISMWVNQLNCFMISEEIGSRKLLEKLIGLPAYHELVKVYKNIPLLLWKAGANNTVRNQWKVIFLFRIMNISGLSSIHEDALNDINRTLSWLIGNDSNRNIMRLIEKTFSILKTQPSQYHATSMSCALNVGKGVYKTDESDLVNFFIESVIELGFESPMISGVGNDWQIRANSAHIQNIRTWLELIELKPKWSTRLLSCLIIHLSLQGVFIKDTDIFPRDITRLLNSDIEPVYNLVKQLTRLFPSFFNELGAEGELREISTRLDEMTRRKDILIHFLRKQSHVESSNQILGFIDAVLEFWKTGNKKGLVRFVPEEIFNRIETTGPYIEGVRRIMTFLSQDGTDIQERLLNIRDEELGRILLKITDESPADIERIQLMISFYKLLHQKYNIDSIKLDFYLDQLKNSGFPEFNKLKKALEEPDKKKKVTLLINYLDDLKKIILSQKTFEIRENIYKKRHITVDIPSMYGSYHEMKFDAIGLTFRIESIVNVLFEELVETIDLKLITLVTIHEISELLSLFNRALKADGINSVEFERQQEFLSHSLEVKGFTFTQYLDIFKGFSLAVKNIINDYFNNIHEENLNRIIAGIDRNRLLKRYLPEDEEIDAERLKHRVSEIFFRDRIVFSLGLQQLDLLLTRIQNTLYLQFDQLQRDQLKLLLRYDPRQTITRIHKTGKKLPGIIYAGNKGLNLIKLRRFGLPVPPGFIITTEAFKCRDIIEHYPPAAQNFKDQVVSQISVIEKMTRKKFGSYSNPLLFSVRSGASISQPGMMDTFLNVGINEKIAESLSEKTGNPWFAWDNYRRFLQCYGMAVGLERDYFDSIISDSKKRHGISLKKIFTGKQMKELALAYKKSILDAGYPVLDNPMDQLFMTIKSVFNSWESDKAKTYRKIMGISDDWGTAITIQAMVYGNISQQSGTGVIFTHNPRWPGDRVRLWGDFTIGNQGEDVVSGLVNTMPISIFQQEIEMRETDITLETHFSDIYAALKNWAIDLIEKKGWTPQEMEFTFETPSARDLFILQTREMAMRERKHVLTFDFEKNLNDRFLAHGIGVSGGAMSGRIVFTLKEIEEWRLKEPDTSLILVRGDTVPDDIKEIYASDGLLTARGGLTSHAAVVTHQLGKTCVVGCGNLVCKEKEKECIFQKTTLRSGDFISIDGHEGSVYKGKIRLMNS